MCINTGIIVNNIPAASTVIPAVPCKTIITPPGWIPRHHDGIIQHLSFDAGMAFEFAQIPVMACIISADTIMAMSQAVIYAMLS